jgi:hypothetical protein
MFFFNNKKTKKFKYKIVPLNKIVLPSTTNISGAIGFTVLINKKLNKKIYLLYDDHSINKYCSSSNQNMLTEIYKKLEKKYDNILFLLEEPLIYEGTKLKLLWNDSTHIINFRKFYSESIKKCELTKICSSYPVDIRICLFDVSIEELVSNITDKKYFTSDLNYYTPNYFRNILYLFDIISEKDFKELFVLNNNDLQDIQENQPDSNILFIKKVFNFFKDSEYYKKLANTIKKFFINYILPNKKTFLYDFIKANITDDYTLDYGFPFILNEYTGMLDSFDHIINGIMEFFTVILANYLKNSFIIINAGFYHSINIKHILSKHYDYVIEYDVGVTDIDKIDSDYLNCIEVDNKYL